MAAYGANVFVVPNPNAYVNPLHHIRGIILQAMIIMKCLENGVHNLVNISQPEIWQALAEWIPFNHFEVYITPIVARLCSPQRPPLSNNLLFNCYLQYRAYVNAENN
jgi:hypothetical protein